MYCGPSVVTSNTITLQSGSFNINRAHEDVHVTKNLLIKNRYGLKADYIREIDLLYMTCGEVQALECFVIRY